MNLEQHKIFIRKWSKEKVLEKIIEIFNSYEHITKISVNSDWLTYEVLEDDYVRLRNPSVREKI